MAIDFSAITDLINATVGVFYAFVQGQTTIINFVIMIAILGIIGVIVAFIGSFLKKMLDKVGAGGNK